jgi:hypothetical protein
MTEENGEKYILQIITQDFVMMSKPASIKTIPR